MDDDHPDDDLFDDIDEGEPVSRRPDPGEPTGGVRIIGATEAGGAHTDDRPVLRFPKPLGEGGQQPPKAPVWADEAETGETSVVVPPPHAEESFELPHYSDPPTGQVPKVVIGDQPDSSESWSGQPRWRDHNDAGEDANYDDLDSSGPRLGALGSAEEQDEAIATSVFFDPEDELSGGALPADLAGAPPRDEDVGARPPARRQRRQAPQRAEADPTAGAAAGGGRNLPIAIAVGVGLLSIGFICFKAGAVATTLLIAVILTMAAVEYFATVRRSGYNPATLLGVVAVAALAIAPLYKPGLAYPVVVSLSVIAGLLWYFWVSPGEGAVMNLGVTLLGIGWIGGLGGLATLMLGQARIQERISEAAGIKNVSNLGLGVIIAIVLITVSYDVGGYFVGKYFGRTPLSAASPNKTQEGLVGGVLAAVVVPVIILAGFGVAPVGTDFFKAVFFCLFCAIVAPLGDLCQSAIKRDLGVKDMGTVLPGHGGVLDRFDAFLFVIPMAWFMAHFLGIGSGTFTF